ncbi:hypothetical protein ANCDUO_14028 [Ancylostoma duodenale]|uniref:WD domain, G-beta repeat protein n=1 Tax=Ancylostoma duodenale TaxID=51022 RepID=A0A0C2D1B0_9BILA|nr:hypothetical protein ANCDUO_14028 [Ancylostoma duodenale]
MAGKVTSLNMSSDGVHVLCSTRDDTLSLMDVRKYQTVHIYSSSPIPALTDAILEAPPGTVWFIMSA